MKQKIILGKASTVIKRERKSLSTPSIHRNPSYPTNLLKKQQSLTKNSKKHIQRCLNVHLNK